MQGLQGQYLTGYVILPLYWSFLQKATVQLYLEGVNFAHL